MLSFLETIAEAIVSMSVFVLNALIGFVNLIFGGITVAVTAAFSVLPEIPPGSKFDSEFLEYANWFYPFGSVASAFGACVTMYLVWMGVRFVLRMVRAA